RSQALTCPARSAICTRSSISSPVGRCGSGSLLTLVPMGADAEDGYAARHVPGCVRNGLERVDRPAVWRRSFLHWLGGIEVEVEAQHVDARLAEDAQVAADDVLVDEAGELLLGHAPRLGHPRHLGQGVLRRDVRVEARAGV